MKEAPLLPAFVRLRAAALVALATVTAGCASSGTPDRPDGGRASDALASVHERIRPDGLDDRRFAPDAYWRVVGDIVGQSSDLSMTEVGRSAEGRPLRTIEFGRGSTTVLLWSQMHGNESTASMALADILSLVARRPRDPLVRTLAEELRIVMLPVLNPDGAARFQRRNAQGIDINRDARRLETPEGRALKAVRDRVQPDFAFNLHDQGIRTRVGSSSRGAAIALLSPPADASRAITPERDRAIRVAAVIRRAMEPWVGDHIAKYDDTFNPRAFGDLMTQWGASTILIESGGWEEDPQKQYLRMVNFVGILAALEAIATRSYESADPDDYHSLPFNGRSVSDLVVLGGTLVVPGLPDLQADLLINYDEPLLETGGSIVDIGDLADQEARDTIDASGLFLVPDDEALDRDGGSSQIQPGADARFVASRRRDGSRPVWVFRGRPPRAPRR